MLKVKLLCSISLRWPQLNKQLSAGRAPTDVHVSSGAALLKANQAVWLGKVCREMSSRAGVSCWEKTGLLDAWKEEYSGSSAYWVPRVAANPCPSTVRRAMSTDSVKRTHQPEGWPLIYQKSDRGTFTFQLE